MFKFLNDFKYFTISVTLWLPRINPLRRFNMQISEIQSIQKIWRSSFTITVSGLDVKIPFWIISKFKFFRREQEQEEREHKIREAVQLAHLKELKKELRQIRITLDPKDGNLKKSSGFLKGGALTKRLLSLDKWTPKKIIYLDWFFAYLNME